jgi:hypothetical protein
MFNKPELIDEFILTDEQKNFFPYKKNENLIFKCDSTSETLNYVVTNISDTIQKWTNASEEDVYDYNDYKYWNIETKEYTIKNINNCYDIFIVVNSAQIDGIAYAHPNFFVRIKIIYMNKPFGTADFQFDTIPITLKDSSKYRYSYIQQLIINSMTFNDVFIKNKPLIPNNTDTTAIYFKELFLNKDKGIIGFVLSNNKRYFLTN